MDTTLPAEWSALCLLVFTLGVKHGFDADHLATIDGLTRFNAIRNPRLARFSGVLFSLGHGAVVILMALVVASVARHWQVPEWIERFGAWVSITFLLGLGLLNLHAVLTTAAHEVVLPVGVKGRWLAGLRRAATPWMVALVGALFALSFDTLSQTAVFSLAATRFGGWQYALLMGLIFLAGMLVTDGINGLWISRLLRRADTMARVASRVMGLMVAAISLLVAGLGLAKLLLPGVDAWSDGKEVLLGAVVVVLVAASFLIARRLAQVPLDHVAAAE